MKVYLIRMDTGNGYQYKIGRTKKKVRDRIRELQVGNPCPIEEVTEYESKWAITLESHLHRMYNRNNTRGEWFDFDDDIVKNFKDTCKNVEYGYEQLKEMNNPFI
jgi:hypothetical protein